LVIQVDEIHLINLDHLLEKTMVFALHVNFTPRKIVKAPWLKIFSMTMIMMMNDDDDDDDDN
jgi:hypothetical protein